MPHNFQQTIEIARPHSCLTDDPKRSGSLTYRYDDTHEIVIVPNIWYNQTFQMRMEAVRWQAQIKNEAADKLQKNPPLGWSGATIKKVAAEYRAEATRILAEAARMESAGIDSHPVAAARLQLNFNEAGLA